MYVLKNTPIPDTNRFYEYEYEFSYMERNSLCVLSLVQDHTSVLDVIPMSHTGLVLVFLDAKECDKIMYSIALGNTINIDKIPRCFYYQYHIFEGFYQRWCKADKKRLQEYMNEPTTLISILNGEKAAEKVRDETSKKLNEEVKN